MENFYVTPTLACGVLVIDNTNGAADLYIDPEKTQFVSDQTGIWAMKTTVAVRETEFRQMARKHYRLGKNQAVRTWYPYYFTVGTIAMGKTKKGFLCFRLGNSETDPERLIIKDRCRLRLTKATLGGGPAHLPWIWLELRRN